MPLVVEQDRLYLHRYWFYENRLAMQIKAMIQVKSESRGQKIAADPTHCLTSILALAAGETDWQREAAEHGGQTVIQYHYRRAGNG